MVLLILLPVSLFSVDISVKIANSGEFENPEVYVEIDNKEEIIATIDSGLTSEIIYYFRFRNKDSFLKLFERNTENLKKQINYRAKKDFLTGCYIIDNDSEKLFYSTKQDFFSAFLSCRVPGFGIIDFTNTQIEVKVVTDIITRPPPLSLLEPYLFSERKKSAWISYDK